MYEQHTRSYKIIFASSDLLSVHICGKKSIWDICSGIELEIALQDTWHVYSLNSNEGHFLSGEKEENMH